MTPHLKPFSAIFIGAIILLAAFLTAHALYAQETAPQERSDEAKTTDDFGLDGEALEDAPSTKILPGDRSTPGNASVETAALLRDIVKRIDPAAKFTSNGAQFTVATTPVLLVYDINADRMRLMAPVTDIGSIDNDKLLRMMQANFESALDARYAIAQGAVWSTFIHPLASLEAEEFASGLGQVVNLVLTYGESYNSGAIIYGGGDNNPNTEGRELIDELEEEARDI